MASIRIPGVPRGSYIVCWYHEIQRNPDDRYQPQVNVVLRRQDNASSEVVYSEFPIALTYLGQFRIGSLVRSDGVEAVVDESFSNLSDGRFAVDFTRGSWRFEDADVFGDLLSDIQWLKDFHPRGPMLVFPLENHGSLWVPCIEFFSRCYGRTQRIKQIISLHSWEQAKERLFGSDDMPKIEGFDGWVIRLKRPFVHDDAVFLNYLWHDPCAERCAKSIYAQLESALPALRHGLNFKSFVKVHPWFKGPAELVVKGFWIDDEKDRKFLALRVDGCSDPGGKPVGYVPDDARSSSSRAAAKGDEYRYVRRRRNLSNVRLTDRKEPDRGSAAVVVDDPPFEVVGIPRVVVRGFRKPRPETPLQMTKATDGGPGEYADSDPYGKGKGVGEAQMVARVRQGTGDVLFDMWETLLYLQNKHPRVISSVAWVALDEDLGFQHREDEEPQFILLEPFEPQRSDDRVTGVRTWPLLDRKAVRRKGPRGLLIMRCLVGEVPVYFVEVERRPEKRENFSGMAFRLRPDASLDEWLHKVLSEIRYARGVFSKLCSECPGQAVNFIHLSRQPGTTLYESAVYNAFSKLGLYDPKDRYFVGEGRLLENL